MTTNTFTVKITPEIAESLIWAINIFEMSLDGADEYLVADGEKAVANLQEIYTIAAGVKHEVEKS